MKRKILWRSILGLALAFVILGLLAPYLNANRFRERIRTALQNSLNRKVELGEVHFSLFTGPGFSVEDVLIGDDPSAGLEPFAHVETLQARLQIASLLTGRLAFSKLRLVNPSVNLVKTAAGPWNVQAFFKRAAAAKEHSPHASFPDIEIVDGRIDLKFGLLKSVFYINDADVDIYPNAAGDLVVSFSGAPARTDRGGQGFGRLSAKGLLHNAGGSGDDLTMAMQLERSALSELVGLFDARDLGVHGYVSSNAKLSGPLSHIAIEGTLNVSDLHRWDLMPAEGEGWTLKYEGALGVQGQTLHLETSAASEEKIPVALKFEATDFISAPKWAATLALQNLPASSLAETARRLGVGLPENVQVDGKVNGGIGMSSPGGLSGRLAIANASLKFPDAGAAKLDTVQIAIANHEIALAPLEMTLDDGHSATIEARYDADTRDFAMQIGARLLSAEDFKSGAARLLSAGAAAALGGFRQGNWEGGLRYAKKGDAAGEWSGGFEVHDAQMELPGIAAPLRIMSAAVNIADGKVQLKNLRGRVGQVAIQADYRFDLAGGPQSMRLIASEASLEQLERLFLPTLSRRQGILANLRLRRAPVPAWLKERDIQGTVQVKRLLRATGPMEDVPLCAFQSRIDWTGTTVEFANASCRQDDMEAVGGVTVNLSGALPRYRLTGQVSNLDFNSGKLDVDGELNTGGTGGDVLLNAVSNGTFAGRDVRLTADTELRDIAGAYALSAGLLGPRLALTKVEASDGVDAFTGQGASTADGRIVLDLTTAGKRQVKLTGNLLPARSVPVQ